MVDLLSKLGRCTACLAVLLVVAAAPALAQQRYSDTGIGAHVGDFTGLTLRHYPRTGFAYDVLAAWDLDDFIFVNVHGLYERRFETSPLNYYFGPGAFIGLYDDGDVGLGVSGTGGFNYFAERFEVYIQLTPRLNLLPGTDFDLGGGLGLRFYI